MQHIILQEKKVIIGSTADCFKTTTVKRLKEIIKAMDEFKNFFENNKLKFNDFVLEEDERTLNFYNIQNGNEIEAGKYYDPFRQYEIKFTNAPDAILGDNNGQLRALLSCGHAVDPNSLTAYCRSLISQGLYKFLCPALVDGTTKCNKQWQYLEVRKLALLTDSEMLYFDKRISELAATEYVEYKACPNCHSFIEREDLSNLRVYCTLCRGMNKKNFEFCWQCENVWTVAIEKASDTCGRENCQNQDLVILKAAKFVNLDDVKDLKQVPSIRACPTCGKLCEHNRTHCKNVVCPRCQIQFCFACLESTLVCSISSTPYQPCSKPIADVQHRIPVWKRGKDINNNN